jgi:hypothetical protein
MAHGFAYVPPYTFTPGQPSPGRATLLRHPFGLPTTSLGRRAVALPPREPKSVVPRISLPLAARGAIGIVTPECTDPLMRTRSLDVRAPILQREWPQKELL